MSETIFFRAIEADDRAAALRDAVAGLQDGGADDNTFTAAPESFAKVPGSPFAYWVGEKVQQLFVDLPPFEGDRRTAKQGLATADDFRFVRLAWEVAVEKVLNGQIGPHEGKTEKFQEWCRHQTRKGTRWVGFAKGGAYSPFYADIHLVIDWENDGERIRAFERAYIRNDPMYFVSGLTWPRRTTSGVSFRNYPVGSIFADKGPVIFLEDAGRWLGLVQSSAFESILGVQLAAADAAARSYEVGVVQRTPVPEIPEVEGQLLGTLAREAIDLKRGLDTANATSHVFQLPALLQTEGTTVAERLASRAQHIADTQSRLDDIQAEIDDIAYRLYGLSDDDRRALETALNPSTDEETSGAEEDDEDVDIEEVLDPAALAHHLLSYALGAIFGRFDLRYATGKCTFPALPDPFAPLPVCAPGMLQGDDGLPLREAPDGYPLTIDADGLLVDDPDHTDDLLRRLRDVFALLFDKPDAIERELCDLLGEKDLRNYFRKISGFFNDHVRRYSKSRRKAPIYWLLQSAKKNYAVWLYYPRYDADTLAKILEFYVIPRINRQMAHADDLRQKRQAAGTSGSKAKQLEKRLDDAEALLSELQDFHDALNRVAALNLVPDHDDGAVLNAAPLRELMPWREATKYWKKLLKGDYEWSSIHQQLKDNGAI